MSTVQDTLQDGKELSHIDKLSKVIGAVQEAFNDGIDPKRIHKVIQMCKISSFLSLILDQVNSHKAPFQFLARRSLYPPARRKGLTFNSTART